MITNLGRIGLYVEDLIFVVSAPHVSQGTPMFIAVELSDEGGFSIPNRPARHLLALFRSVEEKLLPLFQRAFPDGDGGVMTAFEKVLDLETARNDSGDDLRLDPAAIRHDPCYDVQSLWWALMWGLARALPTGFRASPDPEDVPFNRFGNSMLEHRIGGKENRHNILAVGHRSLLHEHLWHFSGLLYHMSAYLCIPWHIYRDNMDINLPPHHAHHAMRLLLFGTIHSLMTGDPEKNVKLNTRQARPIYNFEAIVAWRAQQARRPLSRVATIEQSSSAGTSHSSFTAGQKRTADDAGLDDPSRPTKRSRAGPSHTCLKGKSSTDSAGVRHEKDWIDRRLWSAVGLQHNGSDGKAKAKEF